MPRSNNSRAQQVLDGVLQEFDYGPEPPTKIHGAWVDGDATICVVFEKEDFDGQIGLRRVLEPDLPVDTLVLYIAFHELGEPLGSLEDELFVDEHGVRWFQGDRPEWRDYSIWLPR